MKKIVTLLLFMVCFCGLVGCGVKPVSDAKINYGSSSIYSEEDMNAAIELIKEEFSTWEGCELHDIFYSSDDEVNEENIAWMNELAKGQNLSPDFTQCIMFKSNFHSPKMVVEHGMRMKNIQIGNGGLLVQKAEIGNCLHGDIEANNFQLVGLEVVKLKCKWRVM